MRVKASLISVRFWVVTALATLLAGCGGATKTFPPPPPPTPGAEFLLATSNNQVLSYSVVLGTGALGQPATATGPGSSTSILVNPAAKFAYAADSANPSLGIYSFNQSTGALAAISGSPFSIGASAQGLAMDPGGNYLYAPDGTAVRAFTASGSTGAFGHD